MKMALVCSLGLLFAGETNLWAQGCCTAGSPSLGGLQSGLAAPSTIKYALALETTQLGSALRGSKQIADRLGRTAQVQNLSLELAVGIHRRVSANFIANFSRRRRTVRLDDGFSFTSEGRGIGDLIMLMKYALKGLTLADQSELAAGVGLKIPVGQYRLMQDGVELSNDLQPGTGSWDPLIWVYGFKGMLPRKYSFFGNAVLRLPGENPSSYQLGKELTYFIGGSYRASNLVDFLLQVHGRHSQPDRFQGKLRPSTGGNWLFLAPAVNVNFGRWYNLQIQYQLPVYFLVRGEQLVPDRTIAVANYFAFGHE